MSEIYDQCVALWGDDASPKELLRCVTVMMAEEGQNHEQGKRALQFQDYEDALEFTMSFLLVLAAALVFLMQAGFAMLAAGSVRIKNVGNTMLKNLLDTCGAAFAFFAVGFAIAHGVKDKDSTNKTFIGTSGFFLINVENLAEWTFDFAFAATSTTIVAGALAERCQMAAYLCYSLLLVGWVYPVIVHSFWSRQGFLSPYAADPMWGIGVLDFAGTGVVHLTGGFTALIATKILGARRGRFHDDRGRPLRKPNDIPGHSVALQMLGCFLLWFGWYAFNAGITIMVGVSDRSQIVSLIAANTSLSAGMGGISALFVNLFVMERLTGESVFDLRSAMNGMLAGAVSITGACGLVEPWAAVVIGSISGVFYLLGHHALLKLRIDDVVDASPVHMLNGLWGLISVGLLASPSRLEMVYGHSNHVGWFYSLGRGSTDATLLGAQFVGILFILGWVSAFMLPFFLWLDWRGWLRSDPLEELVGLDRSYHGGVVLALGSEDLDPEYINTSPPPPDDNTKKRRRQCSNTDTASTAEGERVSEYSGDQSDRQDV